MSGTSAGGRDGGEPHLTTNGEVSIASEFNYDAGKYHHEDVGEPNDDEIGVGSGASAGVVT